MKALFLASCMFAVSVFAAAPAAAGTVAYPDSANASFLLDHPDDWEVEPGESVGDYVTLNGPSGVVLQFRTIPGSQTAVDEAVAENVKYLGETFSNVQLGDPEEVKQGVLEGSMLLGSGVDSEKQDVGFAMYFIALPDGNLAEIWYAVIKGDKEGSDAAVEILNSFRAP